MIGIALAALLVVGIGYTIGIKAGVAAIRVAAAAVAGGGGGGGGGAR